MRSMPHFASGAFLFTKNLESAFASKTCGYTSAMVPIVMVRYNIEMCPIDSTSEEDLFSVIRSYSARYVVDTNSAQIVKLATSNEHSAFVLGPTLDKECDFWLQKGWKNVRQNVFAFGIGRDKQSPCLEIARVDPNLVSVVKGKWKRTVGIFSSEKRRQVIQKILALQQADTLELFAEVFESAKSSIRNFQLSCEIAEKVYALALADQHEDPKLVRKVVSELERLRDSDDENVLGDAQLLQTALFFGAMIISNDCLVKKMAWYCDVLCKEASDLLPSGELENNGSNR